MLFFYTKKKNQPDFLISIIRFLDIKNSIFLYQEIIFDNKKKLFDIRKSTLKIGVFFI